MEMEGGGGGGGGDVFLKILENLGNGIWEL